MVKAIQNVLTANSAWLVPLAALVAVVLFARGIVTFWGRRIAAVFNWVRNKVTGKPSIPQTRITFVLNARRTFWNMASRDGKPVMQIMTSWYATNASSVPVSILGAGLDVPNPHGRTCIAYVSIIERRNNWARNGVDLPIQPGQTEIVEVSFFLDPPTEKEEHPLKVKMYITDQYGREHKMPRVKLRYAFPSAETY